MAKSGGIKAGRAFVEVGTNNTALERGLRAAQARLRSFGASIGAIGLKVAAAGTAILAPLAAAVRQFAATGDALADMAVRTGFSVEALSELSFAADRTGASAETLEGGIRRMQRAISDAGRGSTTAIDALNDLGLTVRDLQGLNPEEQFTLIGDRLSKIADPTKRAAVAMELLGRQGTQLLPLFENGAAGIRALRDEARQLGLTISTEDAQAASVLDDAMVNLWATLRKGVFVIGSALAPAVTTLAKSLTRIVVNVNDWVSQNKSLIVTVAKIAAVVLAAGGALVFIGGAALVASLALGGLATVVGAIVAVIGAIVSPIGLAIAAIVGLGAAFLHSTGIAGDALEWLIGQFKRMSDFAGQVFGGISDALAAGDIALAAEVALAGVRVVFIKATTAIQSVWTNFVHTLAGALLVIESEAGRIFDAIRKFAMDAFDTATSTTADWITRLSNQLGIDEFVLGVDLSDAEVEQASRLLQDNLDRDLGRRDAEFEQRASARATELADKIAALEQSRASDLAAGEQSLQDAMDRLTEATNRAREGRESLDPGSGAPRPTALEFEDTFDEIAQSMGKGLSTTGTFSAAATRGLAAMSAADETAQNTRETVRELKRANRLIAQGGAVFT